MASSMGGCTSISFSDKQFQLMTDMLKQYGSDPKKDHSLTKQEYSLNKAHMQQLSYPSRISEGMKESAFVSKWSSDDYQDAGRKGQFAEYQTKLEELNSQYEAMLKQGLHIRIQQYALRQAELEERIANLPTLLEMFSGDRAASYNLTDKQIEVLGGIATDCIKKEDEYENPTWYAGEGECYSGPSSAQLAASKQRAATCSSILETLRQAEKTHFRSNV